MDAACSESAEKAVAQLQQLLVDSRIRIVALQGEVELHKAATESSDAAATRKHDSDQEVRGTGTLAV
jgi:hypothetical protein